MGQIQRISNPYKEISMICDLENISLKFEAKLLGLKLGLTGNTASKKVVTL
jgi:hypothetical protein